MEKKIVKDKIFGLEREQKEYSNKKELMIDLLKFLHDKPKGVELGEFFFSVMPSNGIKGFQDILNEMEKEGWITIIETPDGHVPGMPFMKKNKVNYSISIGGIKYLDELGIIEDKFKIPKPENKTQQLIINGPVNGSQIGQNSDFRDSRLDMKSKNEIKQIPTETPKPKSSQDIWEKLKSIAQILGFGAALIALITKLMDLW